MKPSKLSSWLALSLTMSLTTQSTLALAGNGARDGNGSDAPEIAYTPEQIQSIQDHMNLDYLKLTPKGIQKRDKKLNVIYDFYRDATAGRMAEQIQETFGSNVYVHQSRDVARGSLRSKAGVMAEAVRYFSNFFANSWEGESLFHGTPSSELPGEGAVALYQSHIDMALTEGDSDRFRLIGNFSSSFLLGTQTLSKTDYGTLWDSKYSAVYSSLANPLFKSPTLDHFVSAMKDMNLKGLDATLVFTTSKINQQPTQVLYPPYSKLAPIPQPIVYISDDSSVDQISEMLKTEAPKIYAYNQLFNARILPQVAELDRALKQYPEVIDSLRKANGNISNQNAKARLYDAYMTVSYGMLAAGLAPIALVAMLSSAVFAPIIIAAAVASPVVVVVM